MTSDGPKGNCGFPAKEHEIAHFVAMLNKVKKKITDKDVETIATALRKNAEKIFSRKKKAKEGPKPVEAKGRTESRKSAGSTKK